MVKKLSVASACILLVVLAVVPAGAQISYCKDFLEPGNPGGWSGSLKTFDEEFALGQNETISMDIWINDVPEPQLLTAGFFITYDPEMVTIVSVESYDGVKGPEGPWDDELSNIVPDAGGPGNYFLAVGNLSCATTDSDGDIILGKVTIESKTSESTDIHIRTAPEFDTVVGCETTPPSNNRIYDTDILPNTITLNKGNGTSTTTTGSGTTTTPTSTTSPATTTSSGTSTTTTEPSSNSWKLAYAMMWEEESEQKLSLLRTFRNKLMARNEVVRNYVSLLYQHSSEVAGVFIKHPSLCFEIRKLFEVLLPSIESFFETEQFSLRAGQKATVESFLNQFELEAPSVLKGIIRNFRKDLKDGRLFLTVS